MEENEYASVTFDYTGKRDTRELLRCARALFSITQGTLPMDREFGISAKYIDRPVSVATNFYIVEAREKVEKYLPECEIKKITFKTDENSGRLKPSIVLTLKEG